MNHSSLLLFGAMILSVAPSVIAQSVPDVPEPGIIIYGQVFQIGGTTPIAISSAVWGVEDGTLSFTLNGASAPPTRIVNAGGQPYYVASIPFRTHRVGTTTFAGPSGASQWLELKQPSGSYVFTPRINGAVTQIKSIDGVAQPPGTGAITTLGLSAADRGRTVRIDLFVAGGTQTYDEWADANFGGHTAPNQVRGGDFESDGLSNEHEFVAGTDPKDAKSGLRIVSIAREQTADVITWTSVAGRTYTLETSQDAADQQSWTSTGGSLPAQGTQSSSSVPRVPGQPRRLYRIRTGP